MPRPLGLHGSMAALRLIVVLFMIFGVAGTRAAITIEIEGVDGDLKKNVLVFLSLERYKDRKDLDDQQLQRLNDRVEREVSSALKPFGYYDPVVKSELTKSARSRDWRVQISVLPGQPVMLRNVSLELTGSGAKDPALQNVIDSSRLARGQQLNHGRYDTLKGDLIRAVATLGYLDAKLLRSELLVDPAAHVADIALAIQTAERYRFGATKVEQSAIDESLLRRYIRYRENDFYDSRQLLRTQFALDDSQYFSSVEVLPGEPDRTAHTVPIQIRAEGSRRTRYQFGGGYGTDTLLRGTVSWEDRLVNHLGHSVRVEVRAAKQANTVSARYQIPIGDPAVEKMAFSLTNARQQLGSLQVNSVDFEPSVTQTIGRWQRVLSATVTRTTTSDTQTTLLSRAVVPSISFSRVPQGYLGEALFTRAFYIELRGSYSVLGSDSNFLQLRVNGERVVDLRAKWHLFLRGELGASAIANFSDLPGSQRFFAGGDRSVRGFGFDELSPHDSLGEAVGGRHLLTGTVELVRDLPRNLGVAAFADFGNAFNHFGDPLAYSVGLGIRWRLPVLTVGIDVAQALTKLDTGVAGPDRFKSLGPRLHLNFSPQL